MKKYFMCIPKYFVYTPIVLLTVLNFKIYAPAVQISKQESEKKYNRALELIDIIGKDAALGAFKGEFIVKDKDIQELKTLTPYLGSSKQYANLVEVLKNMPAQPTPKNEQEKQIMEKYKKTDLKLEEEDAALTTEPAQAPAPVAVPAQTPAPAQTPSPTPAPAPTPTIAPTTPAPELSTMPVKSPVVTTPVLAK